MDRSMRKDWTYLQMAQVMSQLSTCRRRSVGCLLLDDKYRIIGSGYNGAPSGAPHCTIHPCEYADNKHGTTCNSIHAEANAIRQCLNVDKIRTVCTTSFPCFECFKLIANTGARTIVYKDPYPASLEPVKALNKMLPKHIKFIRIEV